MYCNELRHVSAFHELENILNVFKLMKTMKSVVLCRSRISNSINIILPFFKPTNCNALVTLYSLKN